MKKALITLTFLLTIFTNCYSQKIKGDFLKVARTEKPKYYQSDAVLDMAIKTTTTDTYFRNNLNLNYDLFSDYYTKNQKFNNNFGVPKYVTLIDFKYVAPTLNITKNTNGTNTVSINSNIYAVIYLIDREKGVFDVEEINFKEINKTYPVDNLNSNNLNDKLTNELKVKATKVFENLSDFEANQYKTSYLSYEKAVNNNQLSKIPTLATEIIERKLFPYSRDIEVYYNYIKPSDEFKGEIFNNAYNLICKSIYPVNNENLFQAINLLKQEIEALSNIEDKKALKYKIAILENIINCFYAMEKYEESKSFVLELLSIDAKNDIANSVNKKIENPTIKKDYTEIVYSELNPEFLKTDLKRFKDKKNDKLNDLNEIKGLNNSYFYMSLSNYKNFCKDFSKKSSFILEDNLIIDYLADALIMSKKSINNMDNNAEKELVNYNKFVEDVHANLKPFENLKKHYDYFDEANEKYRIKVREILYSKYKRTDFDFTSEITSGLEKAFEKLTESDKKTMNALYDLSSQLFISNIKRDYGGSANKKIILDKLELIENIFITKFKERLPEEYFELKTLKNKIINNIGFDENNNETKKLRLLFSNIYNIFRL